MCCLVTYDLLDQILSIPRKLLGVKWDPAYVFWEKSFSLLINLIACGL